MEHTEQCLRDAEHFSEMLEKYETEFPNYCRHCSGWGMFYSYYDPSPSGVGLGIGHMIDSDPCPKCMEKGNCPRCGHHHEDEDWGSEFPTRCELCGWGEDDNDGIPEPPECYCWMNDQETANEIL
jgi:hypothetical protein